MNTNHFAQQQHFYSQFHNHDFNHESSALTTNYETMHGEAYANEELYAWAMRQFSDIFPALIHGRAYPLRTLCGEDLWFQMDRRQRRMVRLFLEQLMKEAYLELHNTFAEHGNEKLYQLK